jgi:protein TIF31
MNHADEKKRHIYVYDRIFFSLTQDTLLNHVFEKGDDMVPTGTSANTDLLNLAELIRIRPPGLHLLHTVLVFYRGHRIIAQTILPGLLST